MKRGSYIQQYGTSYYWGTLFFPRVLRRDVTLLYAFVRDPDNIVDSDRRSEEKKEQLTAIRNYFLDMYEHGSSTILLEKNAGVYDDSAALFHRKNIPIDYAESFFDAMERDIVQSRYETYEDLQSYMYGSAEAVGLMMCSLMDVHDDEAIARAKLLGEAMQYTNFLRDVQEDYSEYGRIYMPADRLTEYGLSHEDIGGFVETAQIDERREQFVRAQIAATREIYREANKGIALLPSYARRGVYIASQLYEGILTKLEKVGYNQFASDAHTSKPEKAQIIARRSFARTFR